MSKLLFTNKAVEDLSNIWNCTLNIWSESQAEIYYNLLIENCNEIASKPVIGKKYDNITEGLLGLRVASHVIFYRVLPKQDVEITRILHGKMDFESRLLD